MLTRARPAEHTTEARTRDRELLLTACVSILPVALAVALAVAGHAWGVPRTDDWSFARVAYALHNTGAVHLVGWSQMTLLGQVVWAQPFLWVLGNHQSSLETSTAVLAVAGLWAGFRLARRFLERGPGLLAFGCLVLAAGLLRDTTTFMTDVPAVAVELIVLAIGIAALAATGRRRTELLALVGLIGFWGFTVREAAIAAPLAILVAAGAKRRRGAWAFVVVCGAFYVWRQGLAGGQGFNARPPLVVGAGLMVEALCILGLGLVPVLLWTAKSWWRPVNAAVRRRGCLLGAALMVLPLAAARTTGGQPQWLLGVYLERSGINASIDTLGTRPNLLPAAVWLALTLAAIGATVVLCGLVAEWLVSRTQPQFDAGTALAATVGLVLCSCAAAAVLNGQVFERYLWPAILPTAILILRRYPDRPTTNLRRTGIVSLAAAGALTVALTANSAAFDSARWSAGQSLVRSGLAPNAVDAGFEWVGAHATTVANLQQPFTGKGAMDWWTKWFAHPQICAVVATSRLTTPGLELIGTRQWNLLLAASPERLWIYRLTVCGIPRTGVT
jgi:hypothetical protein